MSKGEKVRITVPPSLAYGDRGYPPVIPPNSRVTFEIELLSLSSQKHAEMAMPAEKEKLKGLKA